jgi:endonuclease I
MFLEWNAEDPVSAFEMQRQEIIEGAQGNRNPFIDNPYFATLIWDGPEAENLWD